MAIELGGVFHGTAGGFVGLALSVWKVELREPVIIDQPRRLLQFCVDFVVEGDFIINISYEELLKLGSDKYTVKLKSFPSGINQIRIVPEQVDFLIEQITSNVD